MRQFNLFGDAKNGNLNSLVHVLVNPKELIAVLNGEELQNFSRDFKGLASGLSPVTNAWIDTLRTDGLVWTRETSDQKLADRVAAKSREWEQIGSGLVLLSALFVVNRKFVQNEWRNIEKVVQKRK